MADNGKGVFTVYDGDRCVGGMIVTKLKFDYKSIEFPIGLLTLFCIDPSYSEDSIKYIMKVINDVTSYSWSEGLCAFVCHTDTSELEYFYKEDFSFINREQVKQTTVETQNIPSVEKNKYRIEITDRNISKEYKALTSRLYRNYLIHTDKVFDMLTMFGCEYFLAYDLQGILKGIAIRCYDQDSKSLYELITSDDEVKNALLTAITKHYGWDKVSYTSIGVGLSDSVAGHNLIRVANTKKMLEFFAMTHPDYSDEINISNAICDKNNATYRISAGKCQKIPFDKAVRVVDMSQLTDMIFDKDYYLNLCCTY